MPSSLRQSPMFKFTIPPRTSLAAVIAKRCNYQMQRPARPAGSCCYCSWRGCQRPCAALLRKQILTHVIES